MSVDIRTKYWPIINFPMSIEEKRVIIKQGDLTFDFELQPHSSILGYCIETADTWIISCKEIPELTNDLLFGHLNDFAKNKNPYIDFKIEMKSTVRHDLLNGSVSLKITMIVLDPLRTKNPTTYNINCVRPYYYHDLSLTRNRLNLYIEHNNQSHNKSTDRITNLENEITVLKEVVEKLTEQVKALNTNK